MVDSKDNDDKNPLFLAAEQGNLGVIKVLLTRSSDISAQSGRHGNGLQAASVIATQLLDKGADVNAQGGGYGNALQAASYIGHKEVATLLLD
jgi:ankyrin repeat protein